MRSLKLLQEEFQAVVKEMDSTSDAAQAATLPLVFGALLVGAYALNLLSDLPPPQPTSSQPTPPGGKRRSLPAFMQTKDAVGQLGSSSSLPALPSAQGRVPRELPTLVLPSAFDASIFDATAVYETTQDAHSHGSRQLYERTREAVQEAAAAAYNAGQMASAAAAAAGGAGAAAAAARASVEEIRRARKGLASQ